MPGGTDAQTTDVFSGTMSMSWELDIWGRIRRSNEAARATLLATEDARRGVWLTLVSDLAQAYFELLALDVQLQIARNSTQAYQGTYDLFLDRFNVRRRLEAGDVARARRARQRAGHDPAARERHRRQGEPDQHPARQGARPDSARPADVRAGAVAPTVPAGLPSTLLERRPDLRQAEQQLVAANARIGVAKAEFFPKLSLTALFGAASPELSALTGGGATVWAVAGMLSGPLFNAGRTLGTYRGVHRAVGAGAAPVRAGGPAARSGRSRTRSPRWPS